MQLILSVFPGVDLFGRAFEREGFCVVSGPDLIVGRDIRDFVTPRGRFNGVIGGSPCQDFSALRRVPESGYGRLMLMEFLRVVLEGLPDWFVLENVPGVPTVVCEGYRVQRFDLSGVDCGMRMRRRRHFQFGSRCGRSLEVLRDSLGCCDLVPGHEPAVVASEGRRVGRRGYREFCQLMGLPSELKLPGFTRSAAYEAVGNGVPLQMGGVVARSVKSWLSRCDSPALCECGCGRGLIGRCRTAGAACRKRLERGRRGSVTVRGVVGAVESCDSAGVTGPGVVTMKGSHVTDLML